ncbi:MAG: septum formation inhibitor Maf [Clostridiales bacterium]|nr:septum formation inhibitor Maf [Clostridiales bacterium]
MIILASASPRRQELMKIAGLDYKVCVAEGEEHLDPALCPADAAMALAGQKAHEVAKKYPHDCVIGADTIVVLIDKVLGKPKDEADAVAMLKLLSGREHTVYTGVCIIKDAKETCFAESSKVEFYPLEVEEIEAYVASGEPMDKAGAYGIQGLGCVLVKKIEGDYFNIMGFPIAKVARTLRAMGC